MKNFIFCCLLIVLLVNCKSSKKQKTQEPDPITIAQQQDSVLVKKYAELLEVEEKQIFESIKLYKFIDKWMKTPYSKTPDESSVSNILFAQKLYEEVYDRKIPGQYKDLLLSKFIPKFSDRSYLAEGDLIFFEERKNKNVVLEEMVAVYLANNRFVCPSLHSGGVVISSFKDPYWKQCYKLAGRLR